MFQLKPISKAGIPEALEKAERYRFLNEPWLAESICLDILQVDPENHKAIITMLLAITEQFGKYTSADVNHARQFLLRLSDEYERLYFSGIVCERQGKAILSQGMTGGHFAAYEWLREAMDYYERAEAIRPSGNDDAILRWNTCARLIMRNNLKARDEENAPQLLE
ncbi:MAG TPA: hypothetical protein PLD84_08135 [Chitinophagales bacterium]|nr:hypothetical protein [Chitinophagales bacterium]